MTPVFFIAFEFPPANNGGVFRPLSFARYLPEFGIKPIVFTLSPDSIPMFFGKDIRDYNIGKEVHSETEVIYIPIKKMPKKSKLMRFFEISDRDTDIWERALEKVLLQLKEKYKPEAIIVTAPPFTMAVFGRRMARKLGLPLILDMRDAWTYWNMSPYRTWMHYYFTKRKERSCFKAASAIIATSQQTIDDFIQLHPDVSPGKFHLVTNGYDKEITHAEISISGREKYLIGYIGGFYYDPEGRRLMFSKWWQKKPQQWLHYVPRKEDWLYRSPYFVFKTFSELKKINPEMFSRIELRFIGHKPEWFDVMVEEAGLTENVKHSGVVSHKDSLAFQQHCDLLLITSSKVIGGNDYSIAGKTFEYISTQKPILSFVCDGAQKDLLKKTGLAVLCDPDTAKDNAIKIGKVLEGEIQLNPDSVYINSLTRKRQTFLLAEVIKKVLNHKST